MDWFHDEDDMETSILHQLENLDTIKDLDVKQKSQALIIATRQQKTFIASALISSGASVNEDDEFGCTPLMFAATHGLTECLKVMISQPGCVINKRSHSMQTALHFAAKKGQVKCVNLLLNNGAMLNIADDWGETPLMLGVKAGSLHTVEALLNHGARLGMINLRGMDALTYAAQAGHTTVMKLLLQYGCDVNGTLKTSPLHQASVFGHTTCVKTLLENGAKFDTRDIHGVLPIQLATQTDKNEVVKYLLQYDTTNNEYKNLALAAAAKSNGIKSLHTLLGSGADPGAVDMQGLPAFLLAVAQNNMEIVKCLIRHDVDVNKTLSKVYVLNTELRELTCELDLDFVSPVIIAAYRDYSLLLQILVQSGAHPGLILKLWEQNQLPQHLCNDATLLLWLTYQVTRPRTLAVLCRKKIREKLLFHNSFHYQQIRELPLPKPIQEFLNYSDLDSFR